MLRNDAAVAVAVVAPELLIDTFLAEYLSPVQAQVFEDVKFRLRQRKLLFLIIDTAFAEIQGRAPQ